MGKPLRLTNLALGLVALSLAGALAKSWVAPAAPVTSPSVEKPSPEQAAMAFNRPARPPLSQFDLLLEKNPMKQPPPAGAPGATSSLPPPVPLPALVGTVLVDDERRAILSEKGKSHIYTIGQEVAGGVVARIEEDRIVLKRGNSDVEIPLKAAIEAAPTPQGQALVPAAPSVVAPSPIAPPIAVTIPGATRQDRPDQAEKKMRSQAKQEMKQQQKLFRGQFKTR